MIKIEVDKGDLKILERDIEGLVSSLQFKTPITDSLNVLEDEVDLNFEQQGRIYGTWSPLAAATRLARIRFGVKGARPILEVTGKLRGGFKKKGITDREGSLVNDISYAKYHQEGTRRMPQRKMIGTSAKSSLAIQLIFENFISKNIAEFFG